MKHRIAVPDGLIRPDSPMPQYQTGVAEADTYVDAFEIGRMFARKYGYAFLLSSDCQHVVCAWRKRDEDEQLAEVSPVATGMMIFEENHEAPTMHSSQSREGAPGGGCPQCIKVAMSVERVVNR